METKTQPTHTPTPVQFNVRLIQQSGNFAIDGDYQGGEELAIIPISAFAGNKDDAEAFGSRIVRAVNSHEALKYRLELTADLLEQLIKEQAFRRLEGGSDSERFAFAALCNIIEKHRDYIRDSEQAIAKAEAK